MIERNLTSLQQPDVRYLAPLLNLDDPAKLARRLVEVFADWDVTLEEANAAVEAGYAEDAKAKADVRAEGRRALAYMAEHDVKGIVLAGRPYHVDPEVHHGIPSLINGLGMAVLTEDSIIQPNEPQLARPIRVRDQWAYHTRLYESAAIVGGPARPASGAAELLRLRSRRDHHRPGRGDPRSSRRHVHAAQDRRGLQPRRGHDPAALDEGRSGRASRIGHRQHFRAARGASAVRRECSRHPHHLRATDGARSTSDS